MNGLERRGETYDNDDFSSTQTLKDVQSVMGALQMGEYIPPGALRKLIRLCDERLPRTWVPTIPTTEPNDMGASDPATTKCQSRPIAWTSNDADDYPGVLT